MHCIIKMYYAGDKCVLAQAITSKQYSKHVPNFPYESSWACSIPVSPHVFWVFKSVWMCASTHLCVHKVPIISRAHARITCSAGNISLLTCLRTIAMKTRAYFSLCVTYLPIDTSLLFAMNLRISLAAELLLHQLSDEESKEWSN